MPAEGSSVAIFRLCALFASLAPLLASASECPRALQEARAKWAAAGITSYRYTLWRDQGAWASSSAVRVTVAKAQVIAAHTLRYHSRPTGDLEYDITETELDDVARFETIPGLLDRIQKDLQRPGIEVFRCTFHTDLGSPMTYSYAVQNLFDSASGFSITDLEILP